MSYAHVHPSHIVTREWRVGFLFKIHAGPFESLFAKKLTKWCIHIKRKAYGHPTERLLLTYWLVVAMISHAEQLKSHLNTFAMNT